MGLPEVHPNVAHLGFLLGTWRGRGSGIYPTVDTFEYLEEVTIGHVGKPFLAYGQKTRHAETDLLLHAESGYLRPVGLEQVEFVVAQPTGIVELHEGEFDTTPSGGTIALRSTLTPTTATASEVSQVARSIQVEGDTMTYHLDMAAVGQDFQRHLTAELRRVADTASP